MGENDRGGPGEAATRVLETAFGSLLDDVGADFVVFSMRPPTSDVTEEAQAFVPPPDERRRYLQAYWASVRPADFPSWPMARNCPQIVDQSQLSAMERQILDGSPIPAGSVVALTAHSGSARLGSLNVVSADPDRVWAPADLDHVYSVGALLASCVRMESVTVDRMQSAEDWQRLLQRTQALVASARILRADESDGDLQRALQEMLPASDAAKLFVDFNETRSDGQTVCRVAACAARSDAEICGADYWDGMPWDRLPRVRADMERGLLHVIRQSELVGVEAETYRGCSTGTEVDVPVFVDGRWVGVVGLATPDETFDWHTEATFLQALGGLVAARFDRTGIPETGIGS